jgi:hypothetical protein
VRRADEAASHLVWWLLPGAFAATAMAVLAIPGTAAERPGILASLWPRMAVPLHNLPVPEPGEGEMLVRVRASSVNGFDASVANGHLQGMTERRFPVVLGRTSPAPSRQPVPA